MIRRPRTYFCDARMSRDSARLSEMIGKRSLGGSWAGRLVQVTLALYLLPALLIVLMVGGIGMLILAIAGRHIAPTHGSIT
jgi:hypothetical protein